MWINTILLLLESVQLMGCFHYYLAHVKLRIHLKSEPTLNLAFCNTSFSMPSTPGIKFIFSHFLWHVYCTTFHQTTVHSTPISVPEFCQATLKMFLQCIWSIILPTTEMALLILICLSTLITHMPVQTADLFVGSTTPASMSASNILKYGRMLQTAFHLSRSSACKKTYHHISVIQFQNLVLERFVTLTHPLH
jgi:hypothetical protein